VSAWYLAGFLLLAGAVLPGVVLGSRGGPTDRIVGLALVGTVTVLAMLVLIQAYDQPSYLIVPLVLAVLSTTGILVFTRLLGPR
jgi:multicomponent Na+:H+ antiporter subunit F